MNSIVSELTGLAGDVAGYVVSVIVAAIAIGGAIWGVRALWRALRAGSRS